MTHEPYAVEQVDRGRLLVNGHMHTPRPRGEPDPGRHLHRRRRRLALLRGSGAGARRAAVLLRHRPVRHVCELTSLTRYSFRNLLEGRPAYDNVQVISGARIDPYRPAASTAQQPGQDQPDPARRSAAASTTTTMRALPLAPGDPASPTGQSSDHLDRPRPSALELGELVVAPLAPAAGATVAGPGVLAAAQLDPADLAGDRLGQLVELDPAHPQPGREVLAGVGEDLARHLLARAPGPGASAMYAFGTARRMASGAGTTAASATAGCSMSTTRPRTGDLVVARLEHVVGAADVGDVAVGVPLGHVAGVVVAAVHGLLLPSRVAEVAGHQVDGVLREVEDRSRPPRQAHPTAGRSARPGPRASAGPSIRA